MWNGKLKAITFSFDDGVSQDIRMIHLLDKYGLKGTFNLNSETLGRNTKINLPSGKYFPHIKIHPEDVAEVYKNHEVAVHTLTHPNLTTLPKEEVIRQVEEDRKNLTRLWGHEVIGMAYPCGGVNNNEEVAKIIRENTGVKFSRTITSSHSFDIPENLIRYNPTVYFCEGPILFDLAKQFLEMETNKPQLLYIWGHSYECDLERWINWELLEELFKLISGRDDIYYCTNKEAFDLEK